MYVLGLSILFVSSGLAAGPLGASTAPRGGVVEVTGFGRLSLVAGSQDPVTVVVKGHEAARIRAALAGLSGSTASFCMENENAFTISFLPRYGARPTYVATEENCPNPGVVNIARPGSETQQPMKEDCALRAAVLAALPPGRAEGTRRGLSHCAS